MSRYSPVKHRIPKSMFGNISNARQQALKDITQECGEGKYYSQNYASKEKKVIDALKLFNIQTINIDLYKNII